MKRSAGAHQYDVQPSWTVHSLDAVEFDIARCARAADPGEWSAVVDRCLQPLYGLGHIGEQLVVADHADVQVGDEGQGAPPLIGAVVQHDRAGAGNAHCCGG